MQKGKAVSKYPEKIARIVLKTIAFILLFVLFIFILLLTPPVQKFLTARVQHYLEKKLQTKVLIGRISFGLSGKIGLTNVYIEDRSNDTLLYGGSMKGRLNFLKLFSNDVRIKTLQFQDITAKIKRVLPDTVYNFQFIVDAFVSENSKDPDTASSPPMKLDIDDIALKNINLAYTDAVAGSDMFAHIGEFAAHIDTIDPYSQHFVIPSIMLRNSTAGMKQVKPLVEPKPLEEHIREAATPSSMNLQLGTIDLEKIKLDYGNDVSAFYTTASIGELRTKERSFDLQNNKIDLERLTLNRSKIAVRLGKAQQAKIVKQEAEKKAVAQKQAGWDFRIANLDLNDNAILLDDDNKPKQSQGIDYAHISADNLSLAADNFIFNPDSVAINVKEGTVTERTGLAIEQLQGDILYASTQSYVRNLYIKTPGTEIKKTIVVNYPSLEALAKSFGQTSAQVELVQSKVQVKDILLFAPQLKSNPAFRDPGEVWQINLVGSGTMNQFNIEGLRFAGLSNTQIDAHGSLTGLADPKKAGGHFVIERFHTNQTDMALFAGDQISNAQVDLPQDIRLHGTVSGNAGVLNAKLNVLTSDGNAAINGRFANLSSPNATEYTGVVTVSDLQMGKILRQQATMGSLSATMAVNGRGVTPETISANFSAAVTSAGFNQYQYQNINITGSLRNKNFEAKASLKDPNADASFLASGNFSDHPSFTIDGMIDSLKAQPLHLAAEPLVVRGRIKGSASDISADNLTSDVLVTGALFVSGTNRLALDTIQLLSGRNDTANYINLKSSVVNANITGRYRLADMGSIVQNSVQPYFNTGPATHQAVVQSYNFKLTADVMYHPIMSTFVPGLADMKTLHASGNFSSMGGMNVMLVSPYILYEGNALSDLNITANTTADGLQITGKIARVKSGNSLDIYDVQLNATALNNNINFSLGLDDASARTKYFVAGLLTQPAGGTYTIHLNPDNLLLNYQDWTVTPNNLFTISPDNIVANNFVLQNGDQRLSINSPGDREPLLAIDFSNFRLATITGFIKADSVLADGLINGNVRVGNFLRQPNFTGDLAINDLSLRSDTLGNVAIRARTEGENRYSLETAITGKGNDVELKGWFATSENGINLNLDLDVRALQLKTMEGAMAGAIKNPSGTVKGTVSIRGTAENPDLNGILNFDKSSFALTLLGSQFYLDGQKISVKNDGLTFNDFTIKDSSGNALALNGNIETSNFINYVFNLKLTARDFQVLNSTKKENPIYYGRMKISSDLSISGTEVKPVVDGRITVNDGTELTFVVPQPEVGVTSREGIVEFVDMSNPASDSLFKNYDSLNKSGVLGMDVALNIEVKKEAIFNIIVDAANGDFLNAQGEALLTAGIDPSGKITLTGNYTLEKGAYQLSFNFLQRKFEISKGSTITWTGEPTTGNLNVTAIYVANTSPIDLVQDQLASSAAAIRNTYLQKLPFELHLNLTGDLMKPVVDFDILLPEDRNYGVSNDIVATVQYKLAQLREDEGETNKQAFSLLLLNRFVGENPFSSAGGGGGFSAATYVRQSASKLLTEQLNQLAAGLINGVDVNFDVASTEDYTTGSMRNRTDLNLNVSKRLLNDRLKISVGSNFELEGPQNSNQQSNNIAGNVAVDYQLSRDGRYLIRYFRKNDYEGVVDGYVIENGLSFIISVDYNRFREILHKRKQRVEGIGNKLKEPTK